MEISYEVPWVHQLRFIVLQLRCQPGVVLVASALVHGLCALVYVNTGTGRVLMGVLHASAMTRALVSLALTEKSAYELKTLSALVNSALDILYVSLYTAYFYSCVVRLFSGVTSIKLDSE